MKINFILYVFTLKESNRNRKRRGINYVTCKLVEFILKRKREKRFKILKSEIKEGTSLMILQN